MLKTSLITKGKWNDDTTTTHGTTTHRDKQLDTETSDETTQNYFDFVLSPPFM